MANVFALLYNGRRVVLGNRFGVLGFLACAVYTVYSAMFRHNVCDKKNLRQIQKEISILQNKQSAFYLVKTGKQPALHKVAENHTALYKNPRAAPTAISRQRSIFMKFIKGMLSEDTMKELNEKLGPDLVKQVNEKLGDYAISPGKEKWIPKTVYDEDKAALKKQVEDRDKELGDLKKASKDNAELQAKITELQDSIKAKDTEYQKALTETRQKSALSGAILGAKAKNPKALEALLDKSKITYEDDGNGGYTVKGFTEQVDAIKKSDAYLFDGHAQGSPNPQNPPTQDPKPAGDATLRGCFGLDSENK